MFSMNLSINIVHGFNVAMFSFIEKIELVLMVMYVDCLHIYDELFSSFQHTINYLSVEHQTSRASHDGGTIMAKCPKCGSEVSSPKKKWTMAGRPDKSGKKMQLEIGLFDCPKCHKPFRVVLNKRKI